MTVRKQRHLGIPRMYFVSSGKIHEHQVEEPRWNVLREIRRKEALENSRRFQPRSPDPQPRPAPEAEPPGHSQFLPTDDKLWAPEEMELEIRWNEQTVGDPAQWFCDYRWNPGDGFDE
jgi:hypothetical protein